MDVVLRADLLESGWSAEEIARRLRRGDLAGVRRGAYVNGDDPRLADAVAAHRLRVEAAARQLGAGAVFSHESAAVLHGMPVWGLATDRVHATRDRTSGARRTRDLHVHAAALDPSEIMTVGGLLVTTPDRTVVDVGRSVGFEPAVCLADAALARPHRDRPPLTTPAKLAEALERSAHRRGVGAARRAVAFADGRSGSVGESRSRVAIARAGLPAPELQWEVLTSYGRCFCDFAWPEYRVVGEFDGRVKYGRLLRPGQRPEDVLWEEKRREDAIRATDLWMTRWYWTHLNNFSDTAAHLRAALTSQR